MECYTDDMPPLSTTNGCHATVWEALQRAEAKWPEARFAARLDVEADEYVLAATRAGQVSDCHVPACVVHNRKAGEVLDRYFAELLKGLG